MKYAIISDIHGNLPALELVLEDAKRQEADAFLFAGDYCVSAPWPSEVIDVLRSQPSFMAVQGNEEALVHLPAGEDAQFAASRWTGRQLSAEQLSWLDALPERLDWACEGVSLHMAHASSSFIDQSETQEFRTSRLPKRFSGKVSRQQMRNAIQQTLSASSSFQNRLSDLPKGVYIFGHTHNQWHVRFGGHLFLNPGSCGLPVDCDDFGAPYTLLTVENGACTVEERRIPYDAEWLIDQVRQSEQYAAAPVWSEVIFEEWRTCRERVSYFLRHAELFAQSIGDPRRPFMLETWESAWKDWIASGEKP